MRERNTRASLYGLAIIFFLAGLWLVLFIFLEANPPLLLIPSGLITIFGALFFLPIAKKHSINSNPNEERVDERDIMFAREEYQPESQKYRVYYAMRPDKKKIDDKIRAHPELLEPGGLYYEPQLAAYIQRLFDFNESMTAMVDGKMNDNRTDVRPAEMAQKIKGMTIEMGAAEAGITKLNPAWVYSHVGRGPDEWGSPVTNTHKYVIAFTLEMDYPHVAASPRLQITEETAKQYMRGAIISIRLADFIRGLGYPARAHIAGSNYQIMLPPVAYDAGLGELGRHGYLISRKFGSRIRLGAVTTDLPLVPDKPISFGVQDFCEICKKCALNCPPNAISHADKDSIRGVEKWQMKMEQCLIYWRTIGTDCGLCMKICPFSHPPSILHNIIRLGIKNSSLARKISSWGDDLFYGRKAKY
jgi:reductive dehalogenase